MVNRVADHVLRRSLFWPLAALVLVAALLVDPRGDFPLNDDWVYAKAVQGLLTEHRYTGHPFAAALVVAQVLWGGLFTALFGFSFTVLRASTLVLALVSAWGAALCARECGVNRAGALVCGFVVLANPIFMNLSFTFMTDVPFMAATAASGLFYLRALRRERARDSLAGSAFAVAAFGVRQFGVLMTVAYVLTLLGTWRSRPGWITPRRVLCAAVPWLVCAPLLLYFRSTAGVPYPWYVAMRGTPVLLRFVVNLRYVFVALLYTGLFILPIAAGRVAGGLGRDGPWSRRQKAFFAATAALTSVLACGVLLYPLPNLPNMLRPLGTGPLTLRDSYFGPEPRALWAVPAVWYGLTAAAIAAGALLATDLAFRHAPAVRAQREATGPERATGSQTLFLIFWGLLLAAAPNNPWLPIIFDRYLLPVLAPAAVLIAMHPSFAGGRTAHRVAMGLCAVGYVYGVLCARDYMQWNRARWQGIAALVNEYGADPLAIDGGFEFNGMYTSDEFMRRHDTTNFHDMGELGWWTLDDAWAVSFTPRDGFTVLEQVRYDTPLARGPRSIYLLRRIHAPQTPPEAPAAQD